MSYGNAFDHHFDGKLGYERYKPSTIYRGHTMQYVLIIHEVESYPAWKAVFDQAADIRKLAGEISYQLLRYDNNANNIVHFSEWSSLDNARRFFESDELVEIRKKAGVKAPEFIYLEEIERGEL
jgi:heme-degrading monooxygenase HmoA